MTDADAKRNRRVCPICEEPKLHILDLYHHIATEHEDWEEPIAAYQQAVKEELESNGA